MARNEETRISFNKVAHTALPWFVHPDYKASIMASKGQVATALRRFTFNPTKLIPEDEWQANARLIVTACNNYEQVLEVLKYIDDYEAIDINHVKATVRRAIRQVEEQTKRPVPKTVKRITPDIVPSDDGGLAQKAQPPPKDGNLY